jgi:hypothetical protein
VRPDATGRCITCEGAHTRVETRRWIVESVAEWVRLFGAPPAAGDWNLADARPEGRHGRSTAPKTPAAPGQRTSTVINHFGSWNGMLRELGHRPLEPSEYPIGRRGVALRDEDGRETADAPDLESGASVAGVRWAA